MNPNELEDHVALQLLKTAHYEQNNVTALWWLATVEKVEHHPRKPSVFSRVLRHIRWIMGGIES